MRQTIDFQVPYTPAEAGYNPDRLDAFDRFLSGLIDQGLLTR